MKLSPPTTQDGGSNDTEGQVTLVTETIASSPDELVATAKRNAAGQALPKQARTGSMPVRSLLNPAPSATRRTQMALPLENLAIRPVATRPKARKLRHKRSSKKTGIAELVQKYHMLAELSSASM